MMNGIGRAILIFCGKNAMWKRNINQSAFSCGHGTESTIYLSPPADLSRRRGRKTMIGLPMLGSVAGALILVIVLLLGLAAAARQFDLPRRLGQNLQGAVPSRARQSCRIDRARTLSVVELGGFRFAVLSGGGSDQLLILPASGGRHAP